MHKSRLGALVIDCRTDDLEADAVFWSEALGCAVKKKRDGDDPNYVSLQTPAGEVAMVLQKVDHESRVHLDIETDDIEAEVSRLERLGARREASIKGWVVMVAPSGHRFCVVKPQRSDFPGEAKAWP